MFNTAPMTFDGHTDDGLAIYCETDLIRTQRNGSEVIVCTEDGEDLTTILKFELDKAEKWEG